MFLTLKSVLINFLLGMNLFYLALEKFNSGNFNNVTSKDMISYKVHITMVQNSDLML